MWFRFIASYLLLYMVPLPFGSIMDPLMIWVGRHVFGFGHNVQNVDNGSGDTSYVYVQVFLFIVVSAISAIVWTIADRRRINYTVFSHWLKVIVRCYLAFFLMIYGCGKFAHGQFPEPDMYRLTQTYGESSPMGLAWTFLGYSTGYGIFMGISECIGGILILFRRTLLLGACIAATVTLNVLMINLCFDVPVKLFSAHLLLMSLFLVASEGKRVVGLLLLNKPIPASDPEPVSLKRWMVITGKVVRGLFLLAAPAYFVVLMMEEGEQEPATANVSPLYGAYTVTDHKVNGSVVATSDSTRWDGLVVEKDGYALVRMTNNRKRYCSFDADSTLGVAIVALGRDSTKYPLHFTKQNGELMLSGVLVKDTVSITMTRYPDKKFLLMTRGFHWINEVPFNR